MDPEWIERAACRDMDPAIFYPVRGQDLGPARAACARCTVVAECLAEADATEDRTSDHVFGFRGGMAPGRRLERRRATS